MEELLTLALKIPYNQSKSKLNVLSEFIALQFVHRNLLKLIKNSIESHGGRYDDTDIKSIGPWWIQPVGTELVVVNHEL